MALASVSRTLRHAFIYLYFFLKLYILGLSEMLQQPFRPVKCLLKDSEETSKRLKGTTVIVTGGTSGIGRFIFTR